MKIQVFEDNNGIEQRAKTGSYRAWRDIALKEGKTMFILPENGDCEWCDNWQSNVLIQGYGKGICLCKITKLTQKYWVDHSKFGSKASTEKRLDDLQIWGNFNEKGYNFSAALRTAIDGVREWLLWPERWMVFMGSVGVGKTHILQSIANELRPWTLYITAGDLESKVFESMGDNSDFRLEEFVTVVKTAPFLLLDDLGSEYGSDFPMAVLRRIIDYRYQRPSEYVTVVATNMGQRQLMGYDTRLADRILDKHIGNQYVLVNKDKTWRQHGDS